MKLNAILSHINQHAKALGSSVVNATMPAAELSLSFLDENMPEWAMAATTVVEAFAKDLFEAILAMDGARIWTLMGFSSHTDYWLVLVCGILTVLAFLQMAIFSRPPPVPLKNLPRRPALSILFKPDDISASNGGVMGSGAAASAAGTSLPSREATAVSSKKTKLGTHSSNMGLEAIESKSDDGFDEVLGDDSMHSNRSGISTEASTVETPLMFVQDLPDSFAPLLSSSHTEVVLKELTADLLHAVQVEASVRVREGRHEIPLNKDQSRPQFQMHSPRGGCRLSAVAVVGSDNLSLEEDLDVSRETTSRSKPMVKKCELNMDPPMPLYNVAPTLIHIPTLFEDKKLPELRRIPIVGMFMDFVVSISSWLEKLLWIVESFCQINLSNVQITPTFKGKEQDNSPEWRLTLAFSGHVLLFGFIPVPFISVVLPTFVIPQPHALASHLMSAQPLASAELKRENIAEKKIALAILNTAESWNVDVKVVGTPPAVCMDVTLPGGVGMALEILYGRDPYAGWSRSEYAPSVGKGSQKVGKVKRNMSLDSNDSGSSWTTRAESLRRASTNTGTQGPPQYDANEQVPWSLDFSAKGTVSQEKMTVHVRKLVLSHADKTLDIPLQSKVSTRGSLAVWKADPTKQDSLANAIPLKRRVNSFTYHPELTSPADAPSVAALLLFPDDAAEFHRDLRLLQYDYAFDVSDDTRMDAITLSVGANHPMLKGGHMITTMLESIYAHGSLTARAGALFDPCEYRRKRNILLHLPAVDFSFGINNIFIPPESMSYSDDGQTRCIPELDGGRMTVRVLGGMKEKNKSPLAAGDRDVQPVNEGIKVVADFGIGSFTMKNETDVKEFPELDIFEGAKLRSLLSGVVSGTAGAHLRPQKLSPVVCASTGPNIFNPLEAYEVDFSGSTLSLKLKETTASLGHRRLIIPTETSLLVKVVESVVDMSAEGQTKCEIGWDFQGLSPILQVVDIGDVPEKAAPEKRQQASLLIPPLRQGRIAINVSSVGGISVTKAATSRDDRDGLYDWKFFNALVSPDSQSAARILDVLHDKRSMNRILDVSKLVNKDIHRLLSYALEQVWRAKEIFDQEGVSDPKHAIPAYNMARILSLFLAGDAGQVDVILPLVQRAVAGEGLDVVKVKELLRQNVESYDDWAPELDRVVRMASMFLGPGAANPPYVEPECPPLSQVNHHLARFADVPSAKQLYESIHDKMHMPLDPRFSNLVSRIAPYLSFRQVEYFLQARSARDWQPQDLRRIRYVYSIKRKVLQIAESYGGLSFLPQSFLVSVFLGEATRSSLRVNKKATAKSLSRKGRSSATLSVDAKAKSSGKRVSTLMKLRKQRAKLHDNFDGNEVLNDESYIGTPAGRLAAMAARKNSSTTEEKTTGVPDLILGQRAKVADPYELGDSLLGPQDVAILLQAGLTSAMKSSTVVQLNQRMLLDLMASQPSNFASAVLAEIGTPGGQGSCRALTSALMALLDLDQNSFRPIHRLDMHALLEEWLPGLKVPKREDYLAGGRWARQSYYDAVYAVASSILEDAECYMALKSHVQRERRHKESDPLPKPREELDEENSDPEIDAKLRSTIEKAKSKIAEADALGKKAAKRLREDEYWAKREPEYEAAIKLYRESFDACAEVLSMDKLAFHAPWFGEYYKRNYDALMILSMYSNVVEDVDNVRYWLHAVRRGARRNMSEEDEERDFWGNKIDREKIFLEPNRYKEQEIVDALIDTMIFEAEDKKRLKKDPLVRLLIPNPPGNYNVSVVTAMGVITEGKKGLELVDALRRLKDKRGVHHFRADTGTARSFEYNASKIQEAIESAVRLGRPYGLIGYSQGCANALLAESELLAGSPLQQKYLVNDKSGLVCRQLLFSAANGSMHGPASDKKVQKLIVMCEEFFKYQQGYSSRALVSTVLEVLTTAMDSSAFQKIIGGAQSFLAEGCRAFWRESQQLSHVPTCVLRGVMEEHTTPECLEMISNLLTKQSGSALHDSQVHVYDAVGYPVYHQNRNGRLLKKVAIGDGAIQRTHHWSPLSDEVEWVRTPKDIEDASFDCAKDRHLFPWLDVNVRFGFVKYASEEEDPKDWEDVTDRLSSGAHPSRLLLGTK